MNKRYLENSPEEDAAINAAIANDPDTREVTDFSNMRPLAELLTQKRMGRPPVDKPKKPVTIRLDQDVIEAFKATGDGWQTRLNAVLKRSVAEKSF